MVTRNQILASIAGVLGFAAIAAGAWYYKLQQENQIPREDRPERVAKPRILSQFQPVKEKVSVVNAESALGHRFTIQDDQAARFLVSLYFVECPPLEADERTNATLARLSRYFGGVPLEKLIEMGQVARDFTLKELATRPFRLATRFSPTKSQQGIHGFIMLRTEDGSEEYLSEILVREGLASITVEGSYLPYGEAAGEFRAHLLGLERDAKEAKRGIWAFSRKPEDGGATPEVPEQNPR